MIPSKHEVLRRLEAPKNKARLITSNQDTKDIIAQLMRNHAQTINEAVLIAPLFKRSSVRETAKCIYDFLKENVKNIQEPDTRQTSKTLQRLLTEGHGDCKHYSNFAGVVIHALGIPYEYRFADYGARDSIGRRVGLQHVYLVVFDERGNEIYIDCVLNEFNKEKPYVRKESKKIKMALYQLSGTSVGAGKLKQAVQKVVKKVEAKVLPIAQKVAPKATQAVKTNVANLKSSVKTNAANLKQAVVVNKTNLKTAVKTNAANIVHAKKVNQENLKKAAKSTVENIIHAKKVNQENLKKAVKTNTANLKQAVKTNIHNIKPGAKKIGLAEPRAAFLALVSLNVKALATNLKKHNQEEVKATWQKLGGNYSKLMKVVDAGAKKKMLGSIGTPEGLIAVVGIITVSLPVLIVVIKMLAKGKLSPEDKQNLDELQSAVQGAKSTFEDQTGVDLENADYDTQPGANDDPDPNKYPIVGPGTGGELPGDKQSNSFLPLAALAAGGFFLFK